MKITQKIIKFEPINILLQTEKEVRALQKLLEQAVENDLEEEELNINNTIFEELNKLLK